MRTLDGIHATDLEMMFEGLVGLSELDLFVGAPSSYKVCSNRTFDKLTTSLGKTLRRVNIVGMRFSVEQVERFAAEYGELQSLSVWMRHKEFPSGDVVSALVKRIRHLKLVV